MEIINIGYKEVKLRTGTTRSVLFVHIKRAVFICHAFVMMMSEMPGVYIEQLLNGAIYRLIITLT